jgi:DNA-binding MarR family transcriptional regulator
MLAPADPEEPPSDDDPLLFWLRQVIVGMVGADSNDLTMRQLAVLLLSHTADSPLSVTNLSSMLNIQKPAVTRALYALSEATLVSRSPDPLHRGSSLIQATRSGHALCRRLVKAPKTMPG